MKTILMLVTLVVSTFSFAEEIPGKTLLSFYAGSCKTSSQWTQAALADTEALVKTIDAIYKDPDCLNAIGAISQLNSLSQQLQMLDKLNETKNSIADLDAEEQELLIQLTKTSDSSVTYDINTSLRSVQLQRAKLLNGSRAGENLAGSDKAAILSHIAHSANSSFAQITANQKCIDKNPSLLTSATSIVAGVGAAVAMVNPAIGIAMTAGATFTQVSIDGIKNAKQAHRIKKLTESTTTFEAYSCALESMSNRWCEMNDAESFIRFKAKQRNRSLANPDLAQAVTLNDREIPTILSWLNNIRNGVTPRTTADAGTREAALTRELMVRARSDYGLGLIEQKRRIYNSLKDEEQWVFLRSIIISLAPQSNMSMSSLKNPFDDINPPGFAPYYLIDINDESIKEQGSQYDGYKAFTAWTKPPGKIITLDMIRERYIDWRNKAAELVNRELAEVRQPDPLLTISSANLESEPWMITPLDALKTIGDFLENNPPSENQRDFKHVYSDTLKKLRQLHDITAVAIATGDMNEDPTLKKTPIEQIYDLAQLQYGTIVLQARLEMIVRISLLEYIKRSNEEDQTIVAQMLAADRFYETVSRISGTNSFATMNADLMKGKSYTMRNLSQFMELFGKNINRTLKKLHKQELTVSATEALQIRQQRTSMCFLALTSPNVDKFIDIELCKDLKMSSIQDGGPETYVIGDDSFKQDFGKRVCTYRDFFRRNDIYQKWQIKITR